MDELTIHLFGNGAFLQHHYDIIGSIRHRGHVQINKALTGIPWRPKIDPVFVDGGTSQSDLIDKRK